MDALAHIQNLLHAYGFTQNNPAKKSFYTITFGNIRIF